MGLLTKSLTIDENGKISVTEFLDYFRINYETLGKYIQELYTQFKNASPEGPSLVNLSKHYNVEFHPKAKDGSATLNDLRSDFMKLVTISDPHQDIGFEEFQRFCLDLVCGLDELTSIEKLKVLFKF